VIERNVRIQRRRVCPAVRLPPSQYHDAVIARALGTDGRSSGSRALLKPSIALACRDSSQPHSRLSIPHASLRRGPMGPCRRLYGSVAGDLRGKT
jgi:hypothetical protein